MAKRHAREMEDLGRAFFREQEMAKLEKQNKIREERMKLREKITDPEACLLNSMLKLSDSYLKPPKSHLKINSSLFEERTSSKKGRWKKSRTHSKNSPEYAMKLDAERQAQKKAEMEKASREEAAKAMALEIERQKKEKLRKLEQLEALF